MKPTYSWRCVACGNSNAAGVSACERCDCPAFANAGQIEAARDKVALPAEQSSTIIPIYKPMLGIVTVGFVAGSYLLFDRIPKALLGLLFSAAFCLTCFYVVGGIANFFTKPK